jgi:hypothetical protein
MFEGTNLSAILWREQVKFHWDNNEVRFVLDQHAELDFNNDSWLKQQSAGKHVTPLGHIFLIPSQPICVPSVFFIGGILALHRHWHIVFNIIST